MGWGDIIKDTLAIPKSVKKSPGFTKLRSQNSEIRFPVIHDVIWKYYVIISIQTKKADIWFPENYDNNFFWFEWTCHTLIYSEYIFVAMIRTQNFLVVRQQLNQSFEMRWSSSLYR